jgi:4-hydroxy-tetrahydrodipicolinate reductase
MNVYFLLIDRLNSLDLKTSEISLIETHHVTKIDKPSGTALKISNKLNRDIKIESIRDKDNIGIHDLSLKFDDEEILIKHIAYSRKCFVNGVIDLIDKIDKFPIGLYLEEEIENGKRRNNQDD